MGYPIPFKTKNKQCLSLEWKNLYARIKSRLIQLTVKHTRNKIKYELFYFR